MATRSRCQPRWQDEAGFTLVEVMIYLLISLAVIASIYGVMLTQSRAYQTQREDIDVRGSVKTAALLLSWELRQASANDGDLANIGANAFTVRSVQGIGIVCGRDSVRTGYGLWGTSGQITATADDSALVFAAAGDGPADDSWKVVKITGIVTPVIGGVPKCFWGDPVKGPGIVVSGTSTGTVVPSFVAQVTGNSDNVWVGAPFRAFRRITYGLYQDSGRWWLGRKVGAAATYEKLTGPLRSLTDGGLVFTYYDSTGAVTATAASVRAVDIAIRGESFGQARTFSGPVNIAVRVDSVQTRVWLRR